MVHKLRAPANASLVPMARASPQCLLVRLRPAAAGARIAHRRRNAMKITARSTVARLALAAALAAAAGCVVYDPYYPYGYPQAPSPQQMYDRSWNAAVGAMWDQGVEIVRQDRSGGVVEGRRGGVTVTSRILAQADGRIRVETHTGGNLAEDPGLSERLSRSYDTRMGR
jgi:hypothetical protein